MRVKAVTNTKEGFDSSYSLVFENGLVLTTPSIIWLGKIKGDAVKASFEEVREAIKCGSLNEE